jgi:hypothetical protein
MPKIKLVSGLLGFILVCAWAVISLGCMGGANTNHTNKSVEPKEGTFEAEIANSIPRIGLLEYLTSTPFEGVRLEAPTGKRSSLSAKYGELKATGDSVRLTFAGGKEGRGTYEMQVGKHRLSGEWNYADGFVNLWVDVFDGQPNPPNPALEFRLPRYVDDAWTADAVWDDTKVSNWVLVMKNSPDEHYWRTTDGSTLRPSRTEIVLP